MKTHKKHILMTGGGTLGPVTPLMALADNWKKKDKQITISWIGTHKGPERLLLEESDYPFYPLSAPKLDRYKKVSWLFIPFQFLWACFIAYRLLRKLHPQIVFTAGGYVSVPVVFVAWFLGIPSWVHQLDVQVGIANKIMAIFAKKVSVTWEESLKSFSKNKAFIAGSLVREDILNGNAKSVREKFEIESNIPVVCVLGGGTGASQINNGMLAIAESISKKAHIIHLTGRGKMIPELQKMHNYTAIEFIGKDIADIFAASDIVVTRAGMGTLLELAALKKPLILIPINHSHQEKNARAIEKRDSAKVVWRMNPQVLKQEIEKLLEDKKVQKELSKNIGRVFEKDAAEKIIKESEELIK